MDAAQTERILDRYPVDRLDRLAAMVMEKIESLPSSFPHSYAELERLRLEGVLAAVQRRIRVSSD